MSTTELKVDVDERAAWGRHLTITVPAERVSRERRAVARSISQSARLPGFRKGHVPAAVLERHYGGTIRQRLVERMIDRAYREALAQQGLEPISEAAIGRIDYDDGADLTFDVEFDVRPEIELARTGGFTIGRPPLGVSDDEVERVLERLREERAEWRDLEDESPLAGDTAYVRITPIGDDDAEGETRGYEVALGRDQALPDVEEAIRSLRPGGSGEFVVRAPAGDADASRDVQPSEERRIRVELVAARRPDLPPVDDDFARSLGDFPSLAELRERVRDDLRTEADRERQRVVHQRLIERIVEANAFEVPKSMVDRYVAGLVPASEDAEPEQLAQIRQAARPAAERAIKRMLILERIAETEDLAASEEEIEARLAEIAERNNRSPAQVRGELRKAGRLGPLADALTEEKVFRWLVEQSTIEDEKGTE